MPLSIKIRHLIWGHPNLVDIKEEHAVVEDAIAGTGHIQMSGYCMDCKRRVTWKEEYP